ncbi:allophanate hydrolase [Pseudaeromonas sharmana]
MTRGWTIQQWQQAYREHHAQAADLLRPLLAAVSTTDNAWITVIDADQLEQQLGALQQRLAEVKQDLSQLPLYGIPFAVKDNIDVAGLATTAACPAFAYVAEMDAEVVARLKAAGAVVLGKTNLDQFATGLVGTRSPYGAVANSFDADYISGGSSSGSASVVARGCVPFALGTDTAGSGRVPAGFNNLVGWKPTRGAFSTRGVVPACRSLDCVSIFALTVADTRLLAQIMTAFDAQDAYSRAAPRPLPRTTWGPRPRLAVPANRPWFGDDAQCEAFERACQQLKDAGAELTEIDFEPMFALARLLYEGPWIAERHVVLETFLAEHGNQMDPTVASIVSGAVGLAATDAYRAEYQRMALQRQILATFNTFDALLVPTAPLLPTQAQVAAQPVEVNSWLGTYTNFVNLADCAALALPGGLRRDGLPAGITLIAPAWHEVAMAEFGEQWQQSLARAGLTLGATGQSLPAAAAAISACPTDSMPIAVVGAHLSGMPLNHELTSRGAVLLERTRSADHYRLFAIANSTPPKPALVASDSGAAIELELWALPKGAWADFLAGIPTRLGLGTVQLADGRQVKGFICEPAALDGALEITSFGGWRSYLQSRSPR